MLSSYIHVLVFPGLRLELMSGGGGGELTYMDGQTLTDRINCASKEGPVCRAAVPNPNCGHFIQKWELVSPGS